MLVTLSATLLILSFLNLMCLSFLSISLNLAKMEAADATASLEEARRKLAKEQVCIEYFVTQ